MKCSNVLGSGPLSLTDLAAVTTVEDQLEAGHESSRSMLEDDLSPEILRSRLRERP